MIYTGGGESTSRVVDLAGTTGGGMIDSSGTGGLVFNSSFTASGAGSKTLTLQGSNTGANAIAGAIVDHGGGNTTSLVKTGTGTWALAGSNTYTGPTTARDGQAVSQRHRSIGNRSRPAAPRSPAADRSGAAVTVDDTGIIEAGQNGAGSLTVSGLTFSNTATVNIPGALAQYTGSAAIIDMPARSRPTASAARS